MSGQERAREAAEVERLDARLRVKADELNVALGLPTEYAEAAALHVSRVTVGYIGNLWGSAKPGDPGDDRLHFVFLPHPHRAGTDTDRIGGWRYGDTGAMRSALVALAGAIKAANVAADPWVRAEAEKVRAARLDAARAARVAEEARA